MTEDTGASAPTTLADDPLTELHPAPVAEVIETSVVQEQAVEEPVAGLPAVETPAVEEQALAQPDPVIVRRGRSTQRFLAAVHSTDPAQGVIVGRGVLSSRGTNKPVTSRERRIAGNLPGWEPLPPGELVVKRPVSGL